MRSVIDSDPSSPTFNKVQATISGGDGGLVRVRLTPDGAQAFFPTDSGTVLVLDTDTESDTFHEIVGTIPVGVAPSNVAFQSLPRAFAYVTNFVDGTVSVLGVSCAGLADLIDELDPAVFKNPNQKNAFANKMDQVLNKIEAGDLCGAINQLEHDILPKTDGAPGPTDWVTDPDAAELLFDSIQACLGQLQMEAQGTCP